DVRLRRVERVPPLHVEAPQRVRPDVLPAPDAGVIVEEPPVPIERERHEPDDERGAEEERQRDHDPRPEERGGDGGVNRAEQRGGRAVYARRAVTVQELEPMIYAAGRHETRASPAPARRLGRASG